MLSDKEDRYYVYALCNPITCKVFYIGKGTGKRYSHHYANFKANRIINSIQFDEIKQIDSFGLKPIVKILNSGICEQTAFFIERKYIEKFSHRLTNIEFTKTTQKLQLKITQNLISRIIPFHKWKEIFNPTEKEVELYNFVCSGLSKLNQRLCQHP